MRRGKHTRALDCQSQALQTQTVPPASTATAPLQCVTGGSGKGIVGLPRVCELLIVLLCFKNTGDLLLYMNNDKETTMHVGFVVTSVQFSATNLKRSTFLPPVFSEAQLRSDGNSWTQMRVICFSNRKGQSQRKGQFCLSHTSDSWHDVNSVAWTSTVCNVSLVRKQAGSLVWFAVRCEPFARCGGLFMSLVTAQGLRLSILSALAANLKRLCVRPHPFAPVTVNDGGDVTLDPEQCFSNLYS